MENNQCGLWKTLRQRLGKQPQTEEVRYAVEFERTLRNLEARLHESDNADDIISRTLSTACDFYNANWAGFLEIDMDLGVWAPYVWFNTNPHDRTKELVRDFEEIAIMQRWLAAMENNDALIIPDVSSIKHEEPREYTHEAIIDQETFDTVQAIAQEQREAYHQRLGKFGALTESENILQGLIYCKHCGRPLVRYKNVSHGKKLWYTFICPTHTQDPQRCPFVSIREEELTAALTSSIQAQIELAADMRERVTRKNASPEFLKIRSAAQDRLETARRTLKRSQSLYDSLYQNYVEQLITERDYVTLKARYKAETEDAERVIAALEQKEQQEKQLTPENSYLTSFQSFQGQQTLSCEMAHALLDRVSIDAQRHIEIRFRYRDEYEALLCYLEGRAAV